MLIMTKLNNILYILYFLWNAFAMSAKRRYIFVDIDNTVNNQIERLHKFTINGKCDYKSANRFDEIMGDVPLPGSVPLINGLNTHFRVVWLTSRSIKLLPVTYCWLKENKFSFYGLVCAGSMSRKRLFLEHFVRRHSVDFVLDDMMTGYETGSPVYAEAFREFLDHQKIKLYESLPDDAEMQRIIANVFAT